MEKTTLAVDNKKITKGEEQKSGDTVPLRV